MSDRLSIIIQYIYSNILIETDCILSATFAYIPFESIANIIDKYNCVRPKQ